MDKMVAGKTYNVTTMRFGSTYTYKNLKCVRVFIHSDYTTSYEMIGDTGGFLYLWQGIMTQTTPTVYSFEEVKDGNSC